MEAPVERLLGQLKPPVSTIVADTYLMWAFEMANRNNIPVASLWTMSVPVYSVFQHFDLLVQNGHFPIELKGMCGFGILGFPPSLLFPL
jgi:hypothetical protein